MEKENINFGEYENIFPVRGGIKSVRWTLRKASEVTSINKYGIEEENLWGTRFVEEMAKVERDKIILVVRFSDKKEDLENPFSVSSYEDDKGNKNISFSIKGVFKKFGVVAGEMFKESEKSIVLRPKKISQDGKDYFIIEIPIIKKKESENA